MIRDSLARFLEQEILPLYDSFDPAHDLRHVRAVTERALELGRGCGIDEELCATAAAYHDIGLRFGREDHHLTSGQLLARDERLTAWFDPARITLMREAVEDHRASAEQPPRSRLGMILADADREYRVDRILARTLAFGRARCPELSAEEQIRRAYEHVSRKYGKNGYLSFCLEDAANDAVRQELLTLLADPDAFRAACEACPAEEKPLSVERYLARIGVTEPCPPKKETLDLLQTRHLRSVPYENMDILRGVSLALDRRYLYDKIVNRRRGGYCFELNELYGFLLRALGFHVRDCFARFLAGESGLPMRRHHVLLVNVPGESERYLCDVGVGSGSPTCPVVLLENEIQRQADAVWKLTRDDYLGWILWQWKHEAWEKVFSFTEEPQLSVDYEAASFYCEHSPDSPFNRQSMISLRTEDGRITLDGDEFRVFSGDSVTVEKITDSDKILAERFGILL